MGLARPLAVAACVLAIVGACSSRRPATTTVTPAPVTKIAGGVIASSQSFSVYTSAVGGYRVSLPSHWQRVSGGSSVAVADDLHAVSIVLTIATTPRTIDSVRNNDEPTLRSRVAAFREVGVRTVDAPAGQAVLLRYLKNSDPISDGRVIRMEVDRYVIHSSRYDAIISLVGPAGSDNTAAWLRVLDSFAWTK